MSSQKIMITLLIKDHHRLKNWTFEVKIKRRLRHVLVYLQNKEIISDIIVLYIKYASINNGAAYCLKYHNTKPQLHSVECDDHGFPHKGRGLQCKIFHYLLI